MKKKFTKNQISDIAKEILSSLKKGESATILALSGDLGAGKTTLTQSIAKDLGVTENVISPTFVIMKRYKIQDSRFAHLIHIDAYRLNSSTELERLGWAEILADPKNLILIEWPERVPESIPSGAKRINLSHIDNEMREIEF